MQARNTVLYVISGAVAGTLAGLAGAGALALVDRYVYAACLLAGLAGALVGSGGAVATGSARAALLETTAGFLEGSGGFFAWVLLPAHVHPLSGGAQAIVIVLCAAVFAALVGMVHARRFGRRLAAAAAVFAALGALAATVAATKVFAPEKLYTTAMATGAIYGALVWGAVALARRLFGVNVEAFRV